MAAIARMARLLQGYRRAEKKAPMKGAEVVLPHSVLSQ